MSIAEFAAQINGKTKDPSTIFPTSEIRAFTAAGCQDNAFLTQVIAVLADFPYDDKYLWDVTPGRVSDALLSNATVLTAFEAKGEFEEITGKLEALKAQGDARAAFALGMLGRDNTVLNALHRFAERIGLSTAQIDAELRGSAQLALQQKLTAAGDENIAIAARAGYGPALIEMFSRKSIYVWNPCETAVKWNDYAKALGHDLREEDKRAALMQIAAWARDVVASGETAADTLGAVENTAMALADIYSDCRFVADLYGNAEALSPKNQLPDPVQARAMVFLAASAPYAVSLDYGTVLALALVIDEGPAAEGRAQAAGRLLLLGALWAEFAADKVMAKFAQRLSGDAVKAAQGVLQTHGLYAGAADGIVGPAFAAGLAKGVAACDADPKAYADICLTGSAGNAMLAASWLKPFLE